MADLPHYQFSSAADFANLHRRGAEVEFTYEKRGIDAFNSEQHSFHAWCLSSLGNHGGKKRQYWLLLVAPGDQADWRLPREGETCKLMLLNNPGRNPRVKAEWWEAERIDNPTQGMGLPPGPWEKYCAFKVAVAMNSAAADLIEPLLELDQLADHERINTGLVASKLDKNGLFVRLQLSVSKATFVAETSALDRLTGDDTSGDVSDAQRNAFDWLMDFKNPRHTVNLFDFLPYMAQPSSQPGFSKKFVKKFKALNEHQKAAYQELLANLPCGIGIIPGCPGAGKTYWNIMVIMAAQSQNANLGNVKRGIKVLYLLDINKPLDDIANKMVQMYQEFGYQKRALRLYGWRYKTKDGKVDFSKSFLTIARLFMFRSKKAKAAAKKTCQAPTLDEAAWQVYSSHTARYSIIREGIALAIRRRDTVTPEFIDQIFKLYSDTLAATDFIATTPVPAATGFHGLFKPDMVIFDESPHARELSTMIAIAYFNPLVWIFSGDHRQTRPFVATDDVRDNPFAPQMLVSTMERAYRCGAVRNSLLINHRSCGGLQTLASDLFYRGTMLPGNKPNGVLQPCKAVQRFLNKYSGGGIESDVPRLVIQIENTEEMASGTSWWNRGHTKWIMARAIELAQDPGFTRVGSPSQPGTILIIAPYKEAYFQYKKAIACLPQHYSYCIKLEDRLEARTIDTVQGHEADFIFVDFVRNRATDFTDDPNRLCVALTRARQGEVLVLQPGMQWTTDGRYSNYLRSIWEKSKDAGQVRYVAANNSVRPIDWSVAPTAAAATEAGGAFPPLALRKPENTSPARAYPLAPSAFSKTTAVKNTAATAATGTSGSNSGGAFSSWLATLRRPPPGWSIPSSKANSNNVSRSYSKPPSPPPSGPATPSFATAALGKFTPLKVVCDIEPTCAAQIAQQQQKNKPSEKVNLIDSSPPGTRSQLKPLTDNMGVELGLHGRMAGMMRAFRNATITPLTRFETMDADTECLVDLSTASKKKTIMKKENSPLTNSDLLASIFGPPTAHTVEDDDADEWN